MKGKAAKLLCVLLYLSLIWGCSGDHLSVLPDINSDIPGESQMTRMLQAWGTGDDDIVIEDDNDADFGIDLTSVVWSNQYDDVGEIKKDGGTSSTDRILTVIAWEESTGVGTADIWFKVIYRDGTSGSDTLGSGIQVDDSDDWQKRPVVTAHIFEYSTGTANEDRLTVDVAYQRNNGNYWEIWHSRYMDNTALESSSYSSFTNLETVEISGNDSYNYTNPDLVYDSGYDDQHEARLHCVFQKDTGDDPEYTAIMYRRAIYDDYSDYDDNVWENNTYQLNDNNVLDEKPRIDVGQDDSGHIQLGSPPYPLTRYYVGVVWHHQSEILGTALFDVQFCMMEPSGDPYEVVETLTNAGPDDYWGYPYIDIDPVENSAGNSTRCTLMAWVQAHKRGSDFPDVDLYATTTYRLVYSKGPMILFEDDPSIRNGFPEIAIKVDTQDGQSWNENAAYFVWQNDEWEIGQGAKPVEVYTGDVDWGVTLLNHDITSSNPANVSYGESGWDATYNRFQYIPAIAIYDEEIGIAAWVETDDVSGTAPSILGDVSDNS